MKTQTKTMVKTGEDVLSTETNKSVMTITECEDFKSVFEVKTPSGFCRYIAFPKQSDVSAEDVIDYLLDSKQSLVPTPERAIDDLGSEYGGDEDDN